MLAWRQQMACPRSWVMRIRLQTPLGLVPGMQTIMKVITDCNHRPLCSLVVVTIGSNLQGTHRVPCQLSGACLRYDSEDPSLSCAHGCQHGFAAGDTRRNGANEDDSVGYERHDHAAVFDLSMDYSDDEVLLDWEQYSGTGRCTLPTLLFSWTQSRQRLCEHTPEATRGRCLLDGHSQKAVAF